MENQESDFEKIKEEFSEWSKKHLQGIYETENFEYLGYETPVEKWIGEKLNLDSERLLENNNEQVQSLIKIFLNELYNFSILLLSKRSEDDEKEKEIFLYNLDDLYVNQEPDLTSFLSVEQQIIFAGKTNKISFLSNDFGSDINLRIINTPEIISNSDNLVEEILKLNIDEKIDTLENLAKVALEYEFTFYDDIWEKRNILEKPVTEFSLNLKNIIDKISEKDESPLVKIFSEKFSQRILERGQKGMKIDSFFEKDKSYDYPIEIAGAATMVEIAKDFVGIYDMGNIIPSVILDKDNKIVRYEDLYKEKIILDENFNSDLVRFLQRPEVFTFIEKEFNLDLREMTLQDQIHFMNFLAGENQDTFDRLKELFEKDEIQNEKLLKSFLATSGDLDFGENILKIGENFEPEVANLIFEKYSEFVDVTDFIEETLISEFGVEGDNQEMISEIRDNILKTAKDLLKKYSQDDIENLDLEEVKKELAEIKAELSLFVSAFKSLKVCGEACSLENIKSIVLEKKKGLDLLEDKELLDEMEKIYQENYPDELGFSDEFRKKLIKGLEEKIKKDKVEFFVIKFKDELIGFNSFEFKSDDEIEFANFNMKNGAKGGKIGEALLEESLYRYAEKYKIKAVTLTDSKVFDYYINKLGFKVLENTRRKFLGREIVEIELDRRRED